MPNIFPRALVRDTMKAVKGLLALEYGGVRKFTSLKIGKML
jgi:hypothetical protein